jgi:hypothetical protein
MTEMFKKEVNLKVSPSVIKLAERIRYLAEEVIVKSLKKVVSGTVKKLEEMEWPCYTIIREIFGEFEVDDASGEKKWKNGKKFPEDAQVIDKYSNANPHKYNLQNYEDFPPFMKLEAEEIAAKKVGMEPLPWIARTRAVLAEAEESKAEIYRIADQYREQYSPTDYNEESRWRHE